MIVDAIGVRLAGGVEAVRQQLSAAKFFWLDIFGGDGPTRSLHLGELGLDDSDITWALRFGQAGRMHIGPEKLRAVTWMAEPTGNLIEVHVICHPHCILTVWSGDAAALDDIRQQFAERVGGFDNSLHHAAGILLQLLLGTLDHAISSIDGMLDNLRLELDNKAGAADFATLTRRLQRLQSVAAGFNRYSSAVRSAIVGIEAIAGMDARGAAELNDYAEQVEDVEEQFYERRRWMMDIMHDYATAIAQRQGEQINRLTLVSLIFLPVTALTGFFGMNFEWMTNALTGFPVFLVLGVLLPALCVVLTIAWLSHRGLLRLKLWPARAAEPAAQMPDSRLVTRGQLCSPVADAEFGVASKERKIQDQSAVAPRQ